MRDFFHKVLKSLAHASAGGAIIAGTATINLIDADVSTTVYMVCAAILYNAIREFFIATAIKK